MIPIEGFIHAPVSDQAIFIGACIAVVYGIARTNRECGSAFTGLLVVVAFCFLALCAMCAIAAGVQP